TNSISKFTNEELQKVIDYFSSNYDNCSTEISTTSGLSNHVTEIPESSLESIPIESQVSDSSSSKPSQENDQDESKTRNSASLKLPEAKVSMPPISQ
ncbi:9491_t:CDS:2, partial [Cetraspora pellucida]